MNGQQIKKLRKARGWTLEDLAKKAKCGKSYIWEVEQDKKANPSTDWLVNISKVFGITTGYFLDGESKKSAEDTAFFNMYLSLPDKTKAQIRKIGLILKGGE